MSKKYIMLYNHGEDEIKMLTDLTNIFPDVKLLNEHRFNGEVIINEQDDDVSSWVPEEQFLAAYMFINMYPYDEPNFIQEFLNEGTIENGIKYMNGHLEDDLYIKWL